jgi:tripartite-type tricarboxylate transporter receptor subunit TctC
MVLGVEPANIKAEGVGSLPAFQMGNAMKLPRRQFLHLVTGAVALPTVSQIARAQPYPSRPITMVVPFATGGPTDTIARLIAEGMRPSLGQPVIIENVSGASGSLGVGRVARASPDGYTLSYGAWSTHVANPAAYLLPYDVLKDFEPVSLIASTPWLIVAKNAMPANDLKGLIVWLKANPDKALAGTSGAGTPGHVGGVLFQAATDTRFQFVPYRSSGLVMQDLLAEQIDMAILDPVTSLPQILAGKIKAYAVMAKSRLPGVSNVPTIDEAGLPGFYLAPWHGIWAPQGTPKDIISRVNAAAVDTLANPAMRQRIEDQGMEIPPREQLTPEAFRTFHKAELEKWWPIIKAANIKAE